MELVYTKKIRIVDRIEAAISEAKSNNYEIVRVELSLYEFSKLKQELEIDTHVTTKNGDHMTYRGVCIQTHTLYDTTNFCGLREEL